MKKAILSLLILTSLSAFIFNVNSKAVSDIEIKIKSSNGEIVSTGKTDKKGKFIIKVKDQGNYSLNISSDEIIKGLNNASNGKTGNVSYLVTVLVEANTTRMTVDTKNNVMHKRTIKKSSLVEFVQVLTIGNENSVSAWSESMVNIISTGDGEIKGSVTFSKMK